MTELSFRMNTTATTRTLTRLVDFGLLSILLVAPLFLGGKHPIGLFVYLVLVSATATLWCLRQCSSKLPIWQRCGVEWIILAGVALLIFQLTPLPESMLSKLSPQSRELLPLWTGGQDHAASLGTWTQISFTPQATRTSLVVLLAHCMLFLVIIQRVQQLDDIQRIFRWIAVTAVCMACLGLVQFLFGNGKYLWIYEHPYRDTTAEVRGAFTNPNHFAHFLALGIAPLVVWLQQSLAEGNRSRRASWHCRTVGNVAPLCTGLGLGLIALAGFLSLSRGGFVVMFLAAFISAGLLARRGVLSGKTVALLGATGVLAVAALFAYGFDKVTGQIATMQSGSLEDLDQGAVRRKLWAADFTAATHFPVFGTGAGSHVEIYPTYYEHYNNVQFSHTENSFLQTFLELGGIGLALLLMGIGTCVVWCYQSLTRATSMKEFSCATIATAGITISVVHSFCDFVWYIPACVSMAVFYMACLCRLRQFVTDQEQAAPRIPFLTRFGYGVATVAAVGLAAFMLKHQWGPVQASLHWDRYLALATQPPNAPLAAPTSQQMFDHVKQTLQCNPNHTRANLKMSAICLSQFEVAQAQSMNSMPLVQIRDAIRASGFTTHVAKEKWLAAVLGENKMYLDDAVRFARRALYLCPLQGEAYTNLASLAFLDQLTDDTQNRFLDQAMRVRPYLGVVLMAAGNAAAETGDLDKAIEYWKTIFLREPRYQQQLINSLVSRVPADFFLTRFEPNRDALERLYYAYQSIQRVDDARAIGRHFIRHVEQEAKLVIGEEAAKRWHVAHGVYYYLEDSNSALRCARAAAEFAPNDVSLRQALGSMLIETQHFGEAAQHLQWCVQQRPGDDALQRQLDYVVSRNAGKVDGL